MTSNPVVWVNGHLVPVGQTSVSVRDRGFLLGDGLFETLRVSRGRVAGLAPHLARLRRGLDLLGFELSWTPTDLAEALEATVRANAFDEAAARLTVSRGTAPERGLLPPTEPRPTVVIDAWPFAGYSPRLVERGARLVSSTIRRNEQSPLVRVKSLNYLENVLARREAALAGADEAILWNTAGRLAGASAANVFLIRDAVVITPDVASGALPGTTRDLILRELAPALGLPSVERPVKPAELRQAEEVFLTNSLLGVVPVVRLNGHSLGAGTPGAGTRGLLQSYRSWLADQTETD